jgi:PIN domain nuclease of toxin-antitoxin system
MLNLDTHILIYALTGELTRKEDAVLQNDQWSISAIVLWELATLSRRGRVDLGLEELDLSVYLTQVHVWPLDVTVFRKINELDFSSDPADEIIAATSLAHDLPLVTRDRKIRQSRLIEFAV